MASNDSRLTENNSDFWAYLECNSREVAAWPTWMRGEAQTPAGEDKREANACGDSHQERDSND